MRSERPLSPGAAAEAWKAAVEIANTASGQVPLAGWAAPPVAATRTAASGAVDIWLGAAGVPEEPG